MKQISLKTGLAVLILPLILIFERKFYLKLPTKMLNITCLQQVNLVRKQEEIDLHITRDRLNETSFRCNLNPIAKNIIRRQNLLKLVFKDISIFDVQNPVIGSLMREIDVGKKDLMSKLITKAPNPIDAELQTRFKALKNFNDNRNNNFLPQFLPPPLPPTTTPFCPDPNINFPETQNFEPNFEQNLRRDEILQNNIVLDIVVGPKEDILKQINNILGEKEMTIKPPKIEMDDNIVSILTKALEISGNYLFRDKKLEEKSLEQIKSDFDFDKIIDSFDQGKVPESLELFYGGENENFCLKCRLLDLNEENKRFADFVNSEEDNSRK